jgi:ribosomal protein S18 acetylase RimI-like enzyme
MVDIRRAVEADVGSGARCHVECWREAYSELVDPARLTLIVADIAERAELWRSLIDTGRPPLVAVDGGQVVGFAIAGPTQEADAPAAFQLYAINVRQAYYGTGAGQRLFDGAVGDLGCFLWVARDNPRAIAFYIRNGFARDGAEQHEPMFDISIIRMVRPAIVS